MIYLTGKKVNMSDILFERLNKYYPKIKPNIELNLKKSLETKLTCVNGIYNTMVNRNSITRPFA